VHVIWRLVRIAQKSDIKLVPAEGVCRWQREKAPLLTQSLSVRDVKRRARAVKPHGRDTVGARRGRGRGHIGVGVLVIAKSPTRQHGSQAPSPDIDNAPATAAVGNHTSPPWPAPADASAAVNAAGSPMLSYEGNVDHIHAHLDVLINGQPVAVPGGIGIDSRRGTISPLHTHDASGVIHIESPVKRQFSLGEFFSEWQVSLSEDNIGALRAGDGKLVRVFVNGKQRQGNPGAIMLGAHDEIVVLYATPQPGETIPSTYQFRGGL
jgi:hypothetical protein